MKLGFLYKLSYGWCSYLIASHLLRLMFSLLREPAFYCKSQILILSKFLQILSWSVSLAIIANLRKARSLKLPWVLRLWWICSFIYSFLCVVMDVKHINSNNRFPSVEDCADLLNLLACAFLAGLSSSGASGISFSSNGIKEPLLQDSSGKSSELERNSLYGNATLLQMITFSWLSPLMAIGYRKPLDQEDVPDLYVMDSAEYSFKAFDKILSEVKSRQGFTDSTIYKTIFLFARKKTVINIIFALLTAGASYVGPALINDMVQFLSGTGDQNQRKGYILVLAFLGSKVVEALSRMQWIFRADQLSVRLRGALLSQAYRKGLNLSIQSRQSHSSGEIINYMSVDIKGIVDFIWYIPIILMTPMQICLAIYVLHSSLGPGCLAALGATSVVMLCNVPLTRTKKRLQSLIMEAKDERMKATSEALRHIKTLKLQGWDTYYLRKLEDLRNMEYNWLWKSQCLSAIISFLSWGSPAFISVITFGACILMKIPLTAGSILSALATFNMLQETILKVPDVIDVLTRAKVSVDRVASYLQEDEINSDAVELLPRNQAENDIEIESGIFSWGPEREVPTLLDINLSVKRGMKVAICGTVGGGKSSLLSSILGEIPKLAGSIKLSGRKAYVPQSPWIQSGNVRENILFGKPYITDLYHRTVEACALTKDFELFPAGDLTEIGERGINMSGGQKQRIQLARAVYQDADIYLLDDPFSAVDAHTGTQLFNDCLMGILKGKTILYVTHQVEFLPAADLVLVIHKGKIEQAGKFEELLQKNVGFEALVGAHNQALKSVLNAESSSRTNLSDDKTMSESSNCNGVNAEGGTHFQNGNKHNSEQSIDLNIKHKGRLTQEEERVKGSIGKEVYMSYMGAVKKGAFVPTIILAQTLFQVLQAASNYWMAWTSPTVTGEEPKIKMNFLFLVYIILSVASSLCVFGREILVATTGLLTSQKLFLDMLHHIMRAPMSFFDSTPAGRILNRVSTDQNILDVEMAARLAVCAFSAIRIVGTVTVMSQVAWPVFFVFLPATAICFWYRQYYVATARELARLSVLQRSPFIHHFSESLAGSATIRAFAHEHRFSHANLNLIDNHSTAWFHYISAMEWLSFRINVLSIFVFALSLILLVTLPKGFINPSIAGLAVTYGLSLNIQQATIIWNICSAENKMISVERILQYTRIKSEAPLVAKDCRPPEEWPEVGTICFRNLHVRYADHLPSILKDITCTFPGKKRIGVVGRTGSGKSTLIHAIFRTLEPWQGSIWIDDIDICKIGLNDLRSRLSIIPQDPTMFEGTVRGNLDPLGKYSDMRIWEALDKCQLADIIRAKDKELQATVVENGENWSAGQRQLFCLGRVLLKQSSVLVLDEATASIDSATDAVLQAIIRSEFADCTVVTIAHRIHTVIDSDLVLVLDQGRIVEFDSPSQLLEREDSSFLKLIKEYSMRSQGFNSLTKSSTH